MDSREPHDHRGRNTFMARHFGTVLGAVLFGLLGLVVVAQVGC